MADHSASRRHVLFVDDSRLMRYAGTRFLQGACDTTVACDGREAWERLQSGHVPDLIFTDLMMPVMDGHELIRRIRSCDDERIRELPVLVVTSQEESAARERAINEGATDFIPKPFSPEDLRQALGAVHEEPSRHYPTAASLPMVADDVRDDPEAQPEREPDIYLRRLKQALSFHQRQQLDLALLHVQFQGYWQVAHRHGVPWADAVMRNLHRILDHQLRDEDTVHRTARDLFSIILMGTDRPGARVLTGRLRRLLVGRSLRLASQSIPVELRFAAQFPDINADVRAEELLNRALHLVHWRRSDEPTPSAAGQVTG